MKYMILFFSLVFVSAVSAEQPVPDAAFLQHALNALSTQRNKALDAEVIVQAQLGVAKDELANANARIKELEKKLKASPSPAPDPQPPAAP